MLNRWNFLKTGFYEGIIFGFFPLPDERLAIAKPKAETFDQRFLGISRNAGRMRCLSHGLGGLIPLPV